VQKKSKFTTSDIYDVFNLEKISICNESILKIKKGKEIKKDHTSCMSPTEDAVSSNASAVSKLVDCYT
jgi:hypothetical protein